MDRRFTRKKENFKCVQCGMFVMGNGYTNHCPRCLWSLHVDINPGDRKNKCRGMMEPVSTVYGRVGFIIMHRCLECGEEKSISGSAGDNAELMADISSAESMMS